MRGKKFFETPCWASERITTLRFHEFLSDVTKEIFIPKAIIVEIIFPFKKYLQIKFHHVPIDLANFHMSRIIILNKFCLKSSVVKFTKKGSFKSLVWEFLLTMIMFIDQYLRSSIRSLEICSGFYCPLFALYVSPTVFLI